MPPRFAASGCSRAHSTLPPNPPRFEWALTSGTPTPALPLHARGGRLGEKTAWHWAGHPRFGFAAGQDKPLRTPAIYRCPSVETGGKFFATLVDEDGYDSLCVDPRPNPATVRLAKGKLKIVKPSEIDTAANLRWRNATIHFAQGRISPKEWLARTKGLGETVHFLSSPKTPALRQEMGNSSRLSVFAEMFLLAWPGRPCLTADDTGQTRYLPEAGRLQSWYLAMNDFLGPMLRYRHDHPYLVVGKPTIIRADAKPGMFVFRQKSGKKWVTFYLNNGPTPLEMPPVNMDYVTISLGLNVDEGKPKLMPNAFVIEGSPESS